MADDVVTETDEQKAARIAALPLPVVGIAVFAIQQQGARVAGSSLLLEHTGDSATIGIAAGQTVGDDITAKKITVESIKVNVTRRIDFHNTSFGGSSTPEHKIETKDYDITPGNNKYVGPVKEQYEQTQSLIGISLGNYYVDNEDYTITLMGVNGVGAGALQTDKTPPSPPPPPKTEFPWWMLAAAVGIGLTIVIIMWLWKSGRLSGRPSPGAPAAPAMTASAAPAAPAAAPVVVVK